jgi:aminocarboxymuconate-semialdehyde decarboxylase
MVRNEWSVNGPSRHEVTDIVRILEDMDELRIDTMIICGSFFLCPYHLSPRDGLRAVQIQNDAMAKLSHDYSNRFVGLAVLPLQDIDLSLRELMRVKNELGMNGIGISSNVQGSHLGASRWEPLWEAVADMDLFVFIHPGVYKPHVSPTLDEYYFGNLLGLPVETGLNAAEMVFSGLFERYPKLKVLLAHAGGIMPWIMWRWQHGYEVRPEARKCLKNSPIESIKKFYVDTITHNKRALTYLVDTFGANHVLLGSDFPWDMGPTGPVQEVEDLDISNEDKAKILGGNAARLIGLTFDPTTV